MVGEWQNESLAGVRPLPPIATGAGRGVDAQGGPVIDPTENVKDSLEHAVERTDALRWADGRLRDEQIRNVEAMASLRASYEEKLSVKETQRIDAIRLVDVAAVQRAAEVSSASAIALQNAQTASAEALRGQVEAARQQTATGLTNALEPIQKDIAELRKSQYELQGAKVGGQESVSQRRLDTSGITAIVIAGFVAFNTLIAGSGLVIALYAAIFHK